MARELTDDLSPNAGVPNSLEGDRWLETYREGLRRLVAGAPASHWAEVGSQAAVSLDDIGNLSQAVTELDFALNSAGGDPHAALVLSAEQVPLNVALGDIEKAAISLQTARLAAARGVSGPDLVRLAGYEALWGMLTLEPGIGPSAERLVEELRRVGLRATSRLLLSWIPPYLFSQGLRREAGPVIRSLEAAAIADRHPWRLQDANVFVAADRATRELPGSSESGYQPTGNWLALWRRRILSLWLDLARAPVDRSQELEQLVVEASRLPATFQTQATAFAAAIAALHGQAASPSFSDEGLTLVNLPSFIATCEGLAVGSSTDCLGQYDWAVDSLLRRAKTSLEWPSSVPRVVALLAVRVGDIDTARTLLAEVIEHGTRSDYPIESATAKLQLSELVAEWEPGQSRARWEPMRREAWTELEQIGISPALVAHRVTQALIYQRSVPATDLLTRRERDVLLELSRGMTYREAANELGIGWRTVQSHAVSLYSKLGVQKRAHALLRAKELGFLPPN